MVLVSPYFSVPVLHLLQATEKKQSAMALDLDKAISIFTRAHTGNSSTTFCVQ